MTYEVACWIYQHIDVPDFKKISVEFVECIMIYAPMYVTPSVSDHLKVQ